MQELLETLTDWQRRGYDLAVEEWERRSGILGERCGVPVKRGYFAGRECVRLAGDGTTHPGVGECMAHGGAKRVGRAKAGWLMAHRYATLREGLTPWTALLEVVQSLGGQVAFLRTKVGEVARLSDEALLSSEPVTGAQRWVEMLHEREIELARVSKMAIDAGVAERLLQQVELQGALMFQAAQEGLAEVVASGALGLSLTEDQQLEVVAGIARAVVRLEREQGTKALEGITTLDGELG